MMGRIKRVISLLLVAMIAITCINVPSYAATYSKRTQALKRYINRATKMIAEFPIEDSHATYQNKDTSRKAKLTDSQKKYYELILKKAKKIKDFKIPVSNDDDYTDIGAAYNAFCADYPFYRSILGIAEHLRADDSVDAMSLFYYKPNTNKRIKTEKERRAIRKTITDYNSTIDYITDTIVSGMPQDISTADKYRYLAIVLCYCTKYNYKAAEINENEGDNPFKNTSAVVKNAWSIDGPLLYGQAVCGGYAETYKYLCNKAGLYCDYVLGKINRKDKVTHAWNLVKLESGTYYVDTTWMDGDTINSYSFYNYFLLTDKEMRKDHKVIFENVKATGKTSFKKKFDPLLEEEEKNAVKRIINNYEGKFVKWSKSKKNNIVVKIDNGDLVLKGIHIDSNPNLAETAYEVKQTKDQTIITLKGDSKSFYKYISLEMHSVTMEFEGNYISELSIQVVK